MQTLLTEDQMQVRDSQHTPAYNPHWCVVLCMCIIVCVCVMGKEKAREKGKKGSKRARALFFVCVNSSGLVVL